MGKTIKRIKLVATILILIQIIGLIVFAIFYFENLYSFKEIIKPEYLIIGASCLVFFDILFTWFSILKISSLRKKSDLKAAEVIGSDIQEAYNFAQIGLAVTDDNDMVLWTNDLFKDRHIEIIDLNIIDWHNELRSLKDNPNPDKTVKVIINSRNYQVKFLLEAGLWIFKDVTDFESVYKYSKDQAPVLGVLTIDNYQDVTHGEDDFNDTLTRIKNVIFNYMKEYGVLLRKFKDDSYSLICNYLSFEKMKEDKFSIVDKVREISEGTDNPLTISIGLARDFPDVVKLNDLANEALDIAISRGGDQIVVNVYGQEMEFIGGKSEAQEKRNRVKIRVYADSILGLIRNSAKVFVMGHTEMDMDALGACLGILAMCNRLDKPAKAVVDLKFTEQKTRGAITSLFSREKMEETFISPKEALDKITPDTLLIVCDVHAPKMTMAPQLLEHCSKVIVIDHHRRAEEFIESPVFSHIDTSASSSCELIAELIRFASLNPRIELPQTFATIMLSGIFLDSSYFKSNHTGMRTFEACTILKEYGADNSLADDLLKDDFEEYQTVTDIVHKIVTPYAGVVYSLADDRIYDSATLAKAANACLTMKGIHAAFVIGKATSKDVRVSCRSDGSVNVQFLAEKMGAGGGHFTSAAVYFEKASVEAVKEQLLNVLSQYLADARNDARTRSRIEDN
ncbi:MAG: DHH family phosphoesterase [Bacilli bacterium]